MRALKHDQLPNYPNLVETQYVDTLVIAPDFKVAALDAIPLVEVLDHLDLTFTQAKSSGHLDPAMAGIGLYPNLHVCAARDLLGPWHAYCFLRNKLRLVSRAGGCSGALAVLSILSAEAAISASADSERSAGAFASTSAFGALGCNPHRGLGSRRPNVVVPDWLFGTDQEGRIVESVPPHPPFAGNYTLWFCHSLAREDCLNAGGMGRLLPGQFESARS